jgi:hypothetical protein
MALSASTLGKERLAQTPNDEAANELCGRTNAAAQITVI